MFLKIPDVGLDGEFLISGVKFVRDISGGTGTSLDLVPPDAFLPEPVIKERPKPGWDASSGEEE